MTCSDLYRGGHDAPLLFSMAIFNSKVLNRSVHADEIPSLTPEDLTALKTELFDCIKGINEALTEMSQFQLRHDLPPDEDWRHRAKKKLRICTQFAAKVEALGADTPPLSYKDAYINRLHEILAEELDPNSLEKIESEAAELARLDVGRN